MNKADRCDRCGAEAMVRVRRVVTTVELQQVVMELDFCGHHAHKLQDALDLQGFFTVSSSREPEPV